MNVSPSSASQRRRGLVVIAATIWLLAFSLLALINHGELSHLAQQAQHSAADTQVKALATQVADLAHQVVAIQRQPKPISQTDWTQVHQTLEARLAHIEQAQQDGAAQAGDLKALQARVAAIETRLVTIRTTAPASATRRHTLKTTIPAPPQPPFHILGTELRGGVPFLSIAPPGATSLADLRLIRPGDIEDRWQLQVIEAHDAVFSVDGQTQHVAVP